MAQPSRIFRVFISSTFADLKAERDALQKSVFPRLRDLCSAHGCRFQAIDLRWGISEEATLDQQTMSVCLEELRRCQITTPRPNFVILLGQRYGWMPLPPFIAASEFDRLKRQIGAPAMLRTLEEWYRLDENADPPRYCLQARRGEFEQPRRWSTIEVQLHETLLGAAHAANLSEAERFKYEASATHQEIEAGAFGTQSSRRHAFAFVRTIKNLPVNATDFQDLNKNGKPDAVALARLNQLKTALRQRLPRANITNCRATWTGGGVARSHLKQFCADVYSRLSRVIAREIELLAKADRIEEEEAEHRAYAQQRAQVFIGRAQLLQNIREYLRSDDPHLFALHGESGSGKSSILAKLSVEETERIQGAVIAPWFIGATAATTDVRTLLDGLCHQLDRRYGQIETVPGDYKDLIVAFGSRLALATSSKPLVLFLDALDQLSDADRGRNLIWLPRNLPPHVRIVVSTLPGECLEILKKKTPSGNVVEALPMGGRDGEQMLDQWLTRAGRTLRLEQRARVVRAFRGNGLPLYLKLAFEQARNWLPTEMPDLPRDVNGIIGELFDRLSIEANHGATLVGSSLGHLAAARNGLTEDELLDALSGDPAMLLDFRLRAPRSPVTDRLPFIIWSRLYADLEPYLTQRRGDGTTLLSFYHRQLGEQAAAKCLSGNQKFRRHSALADYFSAPATGGWSRRALSELVWQQIQSARWRDLQQTLTNLNFLEAKCKAGATFDLVADFNAAANAAPPRRTFRAINSFSRFIKANAHVLARRPELMLQQAANEPDESLPARAAQKNRSERQKSAPWLCWVNKPQLPSPMLMTLIGHVGDINGCGVSPDGSRLASAGRDQAIHIWNATTGVELMTLYGHRTPIATCAYSPDGSCVASGGYDGSLKLWDPQLGVELTPLKGHTNQIELCTFSSDGKRLLSAGNDNTIRIWDVARRKQLKVIKLSETAMVCAFSPDNNWIITGNQKGQLMRWDARTYRRTAMIKKAHASEVKGGAFSPDGRWFLSTSQDRTIKRWRADLSGDPLVFSGHTDDVWTACVSSKLGMVASGSNDQTVRLWDLHDGRELAVLKGHTDSVITCAFLPGDDRLVTSSWDGTIRIWDISNVKRGRRVSQKVSVDSNDKSVWLSCACSSDGNMIAAGSDNDLRLWDVRTGSLRQILGPHVDFVRFVQLSRDGRWALTSAGRRLYRWNVGETARPRIRSHGNLISGCSISPNGTQILSSSEDRTLRLTDADSGKPIRELWRDKEALTCSASAPDWSWAAAGTKDGRLLIVKMPSGKSIPSVPAHSDEVTTVAVSPDGKLLATGGMDGLVKVWNSRTRALVKELRGHTASILSCHFSPDGRKLATLSRDTTMKLWDVSTFRCAQELVGHATPFQACAFFRKGPRIVTGSYDGTLRMWNSKTGAEIATIAGFRDSVAACEFSADGALIVSASHHRALKVYDGETCRQLHQLLGHSGEVRTCAFSPIGAMVASGSVDGTVQLWEAVNGRRCAVLRGHEGPVQSCAFSPDGERIVSGSSDGTLKLWDSQTGREVVTMKGHGDWVQKVSFFPNGRGIASSGLDRTIKLWSLTGELEATLGGHKDAVISHEFSTDGRWLLSASADGRLRIWNLQTGREKFRLHGHSRPVRACCFSADGSRVASVGMDRIVRLWEPGKGMNTLLGDGEQESWGLACAFSPDGRWLVTGGNDCLVKLWNVSTRRLECEYWVGASVRCLRWHPSKSRRRFVVGDEEGGLRMLQYEPGSKRQQRSVSLVDYSAHLDDTMIR